jgi:hypothetical protein
MGPPPVGDLSQVLVCSTRCYCRVVVEARAGGRPLALPRTVPLEMGLDLVGDGHLTSEQRRDLTSPESLARFVELRRREAAGLIPLGVSVPWIVPAPQSRAVPCALNLALQGEDLQVPIGTFRSEDPQDAENERHQGCVCPRCRFPQIAEEIAGAERRAAQLREAPGEVAVPVSTTPQEEPPAAEDVVSVPTDEPVTTPNIVEAAPMPTNVYANPGDYTAVERVNFPHPAPLTGVARLPFLEWTPDGCILR